MRIVPFLGRASSPPVLAVTQDPAAFRAAIEARLDCANWATLGGEVIGHRRRIDQDGSREAASFGAGSGAAARRAA